MTTATLTTPTPGPYILIRNQLGGFDHIAARGIPRLVRVEQHFISINEHDATNILFWQTPRLLAGGRLVVSAADDDFAPQDHSRGMALLGDAVAEMNEKMVRGAQAIAPVQGPYTISPVRKDGDILLAAPTAPFFARISGRDVGPTIQIANAVMFSKAPELFAGARTLLAGNTDDAASTTAFEEGLNEMRAAIRIIDAAIAAL